jgi:uncharacterized glyoxalase superfamily protein PhnB
MAAKLVPEGHHTLTPYLIVKGAAVALEFYAKGLKRRFDAMTKPRGSA